MATTTWTGAVDTNWGTAGNWSAGVPVLNDTAVFPSGVFVVVDVTVPAMTVQIADDSTFSAGAGGFSVATGETLTFDVASGKTLLVTALMSGLGDVQKQGAFSTLRLDAVNTLAGSFNLNSNVGSVLRAGNNSAFGTAVVRVPGGTLDFDSFAITNTVELSGGLLANTSSFFGPLVILAGATLNINAGGFGTPSSITCAGGIIDGGAALITVPVQMSAGEIQNGSISAANLSFPAITAPMVLEVAISGAATLTLPASSFSVILGVAAPAFTGNLVIGAGTTFDLGAPIGGGTYAGAISGGGRIRLNGAQILSGVITNSTVVVATPIGNAQVTNAANNATVEILAGAGFRATVAGAVDYYSLRDGYLDLNALDATSIASYGGAIENGQNYTDGAVLVVGPDSGSTGVTTLVPGPAFGPALSGTAVIATGLDGTLEIPIGASVAGLVSNGGVLGPGGGVVVVEDDGTPRTPMGGYIGKCGSTYAVRQFP
jgi:hypothetical protein